MGLQISHTSHPGGVTSVITGGRGAYPRMYVTGCECTPEGVPYPGNILVIVPYPRVRAFRRMYPARVPSPGCYASILPSLIRGYAPRPPVISAISPPGNMCERNRCEPLGGICASIYIPSIYTTYFLDTCTIYLAHISYLGGGYAATRPSIGIYNKCFLYF